MLRRNLTMGTTWKSWRKLAKAHCRICRSRTIRLLLFSIWMTPAVKSSQASRCRESILLPSPSLAAEESPALENIQTPVNLLQLRQLQIHQCPHTSVSGHAAI
jgi:hypothetical protein